MNQYLKYGSFILLLVCQTASALPLNSYWQCLTQDRTNQSWSAKSIYQKAALNLAFARCKKESQYPETCKTAVSNCEGFNQNLSLKPMWQCTALDKVAVAWQSNFYAHRDDAALGAKEFCKNKSSVPDTCYINMVTCVNYRAGERL